MQHLYMNKGKVLMGTWKLEGRSGMRLYRHMGSGDGCCEGQFPLTGGLGPEVDDGCQSASPHVVIVYGLH